MPAQFSPRSASALALSRVGSTLKQKYRIDGIIGVGGTSIVYAATHRNGHRVAIKFLLESFAGDAGMHRLFSREAYLANQVEHPGAVPVLDDDVDDQGCPFLIMPLLEGETVRVRWERAQRRMPLAEVGMVTDAALEVLVSAHVNGVVHRDIKPDNLFLTTAGNVRVLDFGIARLFDGDASVSVTGLTVGTPAFMPPEQALGERSSIGPHSDCWAMGATIFTLLSGEYVHRADTAGALLAAAATRNARSLGEVMPDLPPPLVRCVDKALAFDAADRWPSAREMRAAFGAAFEEALGEPASAVATRVRAVLLSQSSRGPEKPDPSGAETETPRHRRPNEPPPDAAMRGAEWPLATTPARLEQPWVDSARAARVGAASRRILHCGDGIVTGQFESSCFIIWRDAVTRSTFERQRASLAEVVLNQTEGASFLCIIEPTCQPPDEELRRASVEMVESHGDRLRCVAVVVEGEGFRAAIARAVISAMSLLRRHRTLSVAAFSSVRAALPWMNRFTPISSVGDGVGFIEEARSRLEPHVETSVHPDR